MFKNLKQFIQVLEQQGELIRIKEFVNPKLEITEVIDRLSKTNGPAVLFENTGTDFPLLINAFGSEKRMCLALGVQQLDDVAKQIEVVFKKIMSPKDSIVDKLRMLPELAEIGSWMPKVIKGRGACQQVIMQEPDITKLPVMTCWPFDGGPFLTLPVIHTKDPLTNTRNVGMYRMQVFGPTLTGMHWHKHKVSAKHFEVYKKLGKKMPVAVALGGDPVYTYCATAPLPENVDEYMLAGFLRKKKVELVQCITQDVQVPADADFVIEGFVDPADELIWEGPFGDHTGYYSLADWYPRFHITAITHRKEAVYPSTIVGVPPQEDAWLGKATERIFLSPIKMTVVPEIIDMELPIEGVFHNLTIIKIEKSYSGHAQKVMNAMWGAGQMMFNKILVVVDQHTDAHNYLDVAQAITKHVDPANDIYFSQGPMDVLDHSCSKFAFGGKMGIDATEKTEDEKTGDPQTEFHIQQLNFPELKLQFPEIISVNATLLKQQISLLILSVKKNKALHIAQLSKALHEAAFFKDFKFILMVDENVNTNNLKEVVWRWSNNLDARRDSFVFKSSSTSPAQIYLDGTMKTKSLDGFERPWPNILVMDEKVIETIDKKWTSLGFNDFIASPSLQFTHEKNINSATAIND